jgi:hypothetical protein
MRSVKQDPETVPLPAKTYISFIIVLFPAGPHTLWKKYYGASYPAEPSCAGLLPGGIKFIKFHSPSEPQKKRQELYKI